MSSLSIKDRQVGNVIVLDIDGNLRIDGDSASALQKAIRRLLAEGQNQILLNLARVAYIDSSGLGELIASHITVKKSGGEVKLVHLTPRVRELMIVTKLLTILDVYEDEAEALDSFKRFGTVVATPQSGARTDTYHERHA